MRWWLQAATVFLLGGCEADGVKCNRARVSAHDAWRTVAAAASEAYVTLGADCFLQPQQACTAFDGNRDAARTYAQAVRLLKQDADRAGAAISSSAIAVRDIAASVRTSSTFLNDRTPKLLQATTQAVATSDQLWDACKDIAP